MLPHVGAVAAGLATELLLDALLLITTGTRTPPVGLGEVAGAETAAELCETDTAELDCLPGPELDPDPDAGLDGLAECGADVDSAIEEAAEEEGR